ncbi:MAG: signal peptidase I, partial [Bacteroidia bacterium]
MKRLATILGLAIIALVSIYLVAAALGVLSVYHIPTPAMEPTVKVGEYVISTNVIKYKRGDLVSFLYPLSDYNEYYLKRLCALPGDKVEMKEG